MLVCCYIFVSDTVHNVRLQIMISVFPEVMIVFHHGWNIPSLLKVSRILRSQPDPEEDIIFGIDDLVHVDSTDAIAAKDEPIFDFYLLQVTSKLDLTTYTSTDYGSDFPPYTTIFTGHFILRELLDMMDILEERQQTMVAVSTVW